MPKTFYCPTCKEFPDEIVEHYTSVRETRKWDGDDTYELIDSEFFDEVSETTCKKCGSTLKEREEVETNG